MEKYRGVIIYKEKEFLGFRGTKQDELKECNPEYNIWYRFGDSARYDSIQDAKEGVDNTFAHADKIGIKTDANFVAFLNSKS